MESPRTESGDLESLEPRVLLNLKMGSIFGKERNYY